MPAAMMGPGRTGRASDRAGDRKRCMALSQSRFTVTVARRRSTSLGRARRDRPVTVAAAGPLRRPVTRNRVVSAETVRVI
eukprot:568002-Hanusia_phi.AAC.1